MLRVSSLVLSIFFISHISLGQCNTDLEPIDNKKLAYKFRENRCEGFFKMEVGSPQMELVGFMQGALQFEADPNEEVYLSSVRASDEPTYIRAVGLPINLYYRMDGSLVGKEKFKWNVGEVLILNNETKHASNIGVLGYRHEEEEDVFVPLRSESQLADSSTDKALNLFIRTGKTLRQIWLQIDDNNTELIRDRRLRVGQTVMITLPEGLRGKHRIQIVGQEASTHEYLSPFDFFIDL